MSQPTIDLNRRGMLFVLSSPSGAGKSTIARRLLAADPGLEMSVSTTTRPMRPGEAEGVDYHFVGLPRFKDMVGDGEFLEWAHVFGHRYGTPRAPVNAILAAGRDVLFDIDWQGAQQLYQQAGGDVVRVIARIRPTWRHKGLGALDRSRQVLLHRAAIIQYPALWWAGVRGMAPLHVSAVQVGGAGLATLTARSTRPSVASLSPWWRRS